MQMSERPFHDLHSHTLCSDGELSPGDLVQLAAQQGVTVMALSDHDTVDGLPEAQEAGRQHGIEVIPAIELSATHGNREYHILGYFVRDPAVLQPVLDEICESRRTRAQRMVELLCEMGFPIEWSAVQRRSQGKVIGRPHIAEELIAQGHVSNFSSDLSLFFLW